MKAALGLRVHSGWAAAVVVGGTPSALVVLDRRRIVLADEGALPGSKQPFHAMEGRKAPEAERMHAAFVADAGRRAVEELRKVLRDAASAGHALPGCGILLSSARPLPDLSRILASHALIHTAEGVHFRDALAEAAGACSMNVIPVTEREVEARAAAAARAPAEALRGRIAAFGKALGPPWTQDQKLAALAGLLALGSL
jgi:hypothetical protein